MTSFLIVHGWQNRQPEEHWQHWLMRELTAAGHQVWYPPLPDPDHPEPAAWVNAIRHELANMHGPERVVICHSLGCMAWLHLAGHGPLSRPVDRLLFVAPPSPKYLASEPALAAFQPAPEALTHLASTVRTLPRLVCSNNDPYCEGGADHVYPIGFDLNLVRGDGHFDIPAGYGEWPSVLEWCHNSNVRITSRTQTRVAVT